MTIRSSIRPCSSVSEISELERKVLLKRDKLYKQRAFCDFTFTVYEEGNITQIGCHRIILASTSSYFSNLLEFGEYVKEMSIRGFNYSSVNELVNYMYNCYITITEDNSFHLLRLSKCWKVDEVTDWCKEFIFEGLNTSNCLEIRDKFLFAGCHRAAEDVQSFVCEHFLKIVKIDYFLMVSVHYLQMLLDSDYLNAEDELDVYSAIKKWICSDYRNRAGYISKLLLKVRLPLLPSTAVSELMFDPFFGTSQELESFVRESIYYSTKGMIRKGQDVIKNKHLTARNSQNSKVVKKSNVKTNTLVCIGGWNRHINSLKSVEYSSDDGRTWKSGPNMLTAKSQFGATVYEGFIYVVGGRLNSSCLSNKKTCEKFNIRCGTWESIVDLPAPRSDIALACLNGTLYATGGVSQNGEEVRSVLTLNLAHAKLWQRETAKMVDERSGHAICAVNGKLYCINGLKLNSCEKFDPVTNKWKRIVPTKYERWFPGVCVDYLNYIYVAGGSHDRVKLSSVEMYNPQNDEWFMVTTSSLSKARDGLTLTFHNKKMIVIGGDTNDNELEDKVEEFNDHKDSWSAIGSLSIARCGHATFSVPEYVTDGP